jgi:hypothetical protein
MICNARTAALAWRFPKRRFCCSHARCQHDYLQTRCFESFTATASTLGLQLEFWRGHGGNPGFPIIPVCADWI